MRKMIFPAACAVLMLVACTSLSTTVNGNETKEQKAFEKSIDKKDYIPPIHG